MKPSLSVSDGCTMQQGGRAIGGRPPAQFVFDESYLTGLRGGNEEIARHFDGHFRYLLRRWLWGKFTREQEEELVDQTMISAYERIRNGQPKDAARLSAYVTGICVNLTKLTLRQSFNRGGEDIADIQLRNPALNAEEQLLEREQAREVRSILHNLGWRDRGILVDLFFHERKRTEVCVRYGVSREMLRLVLFRARRRFQDGWIGRN